MVYLSAVHTAVLGTATPAVIAVHVIPVPGLVGFPKVDSNPADVV